MDGATLWGRVLEGVPPSNGELSLRAGTFTELLQALAVRPSADARVADVLPRGSRLAAAMKNAGGGLGPYSLEGSHVVIALADEGDAAHDAAGGGPHVRTLYILPLEAVVFVAFAAAVSAYAAKLAAGKRSDGLIALNDVWALVAASGVATSAEGKRLFL